MPTVCPPPILACDAPIAVAPAVACKLADGTAVTARLDGGQVIVSFANGQTAAFSEGATGNDLSPLFRQVFHVPDCGPIS